MTQVHWNGNLHWKCNNYKSTNSSFLHCLEHHLFWILADIEYVCWYWCVCNRPIFGNWHISQLYCRIPYAQFLHLCLVSSLMHLWHDMYRLTTCVVHLFSLSDRMGGSSSSPVATVGAEATMAAPPHGCPMHKEAQPVKGTAVGGWRDHHVNGQF